MKSQKLIMTFILAIFVSIAANATHTSRIYVSINGNDSGSVGLLTSPFRHIQNAINYSINGDTIIIQNGVYYENIDLSNKAIYINGFDPSLTILDGNNSGIGIIVRSPQAVIEGLSIRNTAPPSYQIKWVSSYGYHTSGTGIFAGDQSNKPLVKNCWIYNNEIGIYGNADVKNCKIYNNNSGYNGYWVHPIIDQSYFYNNTNAIGISNAENSAVRNCLFYRNTTVFSLRSDLNNWGFRFDIINSTIASNQNIIYTSEGNKTFITNSIIYGNSNPTLPFTQSHDSAIIVNSIIQLGKNAIPSGSWNKLYYDDLTNFSSNPDFIDTLSFNISNNSIAIGKGSNAIAPSIDILGNTRPNPFGSNVDIGAYENPLGTSVLNISSFSGANGSITPSGNTTIYVNATQRYTFTANSGYMVDSVIVDGNKVDSVSGYTFSSLTSNHTIHVTYKALNIPSYVTTNGLVGWWPFNGNANDESGNGNNGTVNGATLINDRKGSANKAYSFDGINDWIEINNFSFSNSNSYSISCWVQLNVGYSSGYPQHYIWDNGVISNGLFLNLDADLIQFSCQDFNTNVPIGSWHNYLTTVQNNQIKLYFDGNLVKTTSCNMTMLNNRSLKFGTSCINTEYTNGLIDDIAIYNRALSQAEISALYNGSFSIVASSGANGSISPSGTTAVNSGSSQTYTFTPNSGYWIDSVIVNGVQVPTASSYTFNNVSSDQTIRVTYRSLAAALAAANICANDTLVSTVNLPAQSLVRATTYYSNIYLFNQNNTGNAYKYNVNDRKYTAIANKPTACIECGVAEANGKVYCFNTNGTTEAYDIASNTWQVKASLPAGAGIDAGFYATSLNNEIYLMGSSMGLTQTAFYKYNSLNNTFTSLNTPAQASIHSRLISFNNNLYKIGGEYYDGNQSLALSLFEVFNPSTNSWSKLPAMPEALSRVGATVYNNKIYVYGGNVPYGAVSNKVYVFDFTSNAWYAESNSLHAKYFEIEAKTANNMVFLFGGIDTTGSASNQALRYFCKDQLCTCKWAEYVCNGVSQDEPCKILTISLYKPGTVFCNGYATKVVDVTNPITGKTWMDRNLGASRAATSSTDTLAYGDLYQWGRGSDGHQCRNSATTTTLSTTDQPGHGNFIVSSNSPYDWRSTQNNNLWQGVNGINNPCPTGYRIPTEIELTDEMLSWTTLTSNAVFSSVLKLPFSGRRDPVSSTMADVGNVGYYYSDKPSNTNSYYLGFSTAGMSVHNNNYRAGGNSIRCIKDYAASIGTFDTTALSNQGDLYSGLAANNVTSTINYTNGNGANYDSLVISSTGVTGLKATLATGTLNNGNGTLTFTITGTPSTSGVASFAISFGGKTCVITRTINLPIGSYKPGTVFCSGTPTAVVDVTNPITGKIWMDRNLGASRAATSKTDADAYGDLYQWGRGADGHQCRNSAITTTLSTTDQPGHSKYILSPNVPNDWRSTQNNNLWQGANGVNNPCPIGYAIPTESEIISELNTWSALNDSGAYASVLKLSLAGARVYDFGGFGNVGAGGHYWSSSVNGNQSRFIHFSFNTAFTGNYDRAFGCTIRCIKNNPASVGSLDTTALSNQGDLYSGLAANNVTTTLNYTNGNGANYDSLVISSTGGVTDLKATLATGTLNNGNGTLTFTITGTPSTSGVASFAISFGGKTCVITRTINLPIGSYKPGTVFCSGTPTAVVDVTNPITGKTWMDRNLGASRAATSSTDTLAYGDLYQWGRGSDGHQCRNSSTTTFLSSTDNPTHSSFILSPNYPYDWRSIKNDNLWQGVNGANNPCPNGYRLPTYNELESERLSWPSNNPLGAFLSPLKLPASGYKNVGDGSMSAVGYNCGYWSSTVDVFTSWLLYFQTGHIAYMSSNYKAGGSSVRCIKD